MEDCPAHDDLRKYLEITKQPTRTTGEGRFAIKEKKREGISTNRMT